MTRFTCILAVSLALCLPVAYARDDALAGVSETRLVVEELPEDAGWCGVKMDDVEATVLFLLGQVGPKVSTESRKSILYVNVGIARAVKYDACVYAISMAFQVPAAAKHNNEFVFGNAWEASHYGMAPRAFTPGAVKAVLERFTKRLAVKWASKN